MAPGARVRGRPAGCVPRPFRGISSRPRLGSMSTPEPPSRRLTKRMRMHPPLEARLIMGTEAVGGWIVDQQDDGLGLRFGGTDANRLRDEAPRWLGGDVVLRLVCEDAPPDVLPVRIRHVTQQPGGRGECVVGLTYDHARMRPEHVLALLDTWTRISKPKTIPPPQGVVPPRE